MRQVRVFHLLQKARSALFRAVDQSLNHQFGLRATQQAVLFILMERDGAPITDIAEQLQVGKSSLTGLIDRMAERGYLRREQSTADGRSYTIFIEPKGRVLCEQTLPATRRINAALLEPFSDSEQDTIARFLHHVADNAATIVTSETAPPHTEPQGPPQ